MSELRNAEEPRGTSAHELDSRPDHLWPRLIVGGLLLVVVVNFAFIWIAVSGADDIVPSYVEEER